MKMVAGCPKCSARYRVDADRIGPDGAKLRCTKCSAVFLVRVPRVQDVAPVPPVVETPAEAPVVTVTPPPVDTPLPAPEIDPARLVIIADSNEARGKKSAEAVARWGLAQHLVHDGVEAMLSIQRMLPAAVVLDAALPKMFGFQVCEVIKRNESLRNTRVVLVGAIHDQDRYRRNPTDLYGADVYIEGPDLPDGLKSILEEAGLPLNEVAGPDAIARPRVEPAAVPPPTPEAVSLPSPVPEADFEIKSSPAVETPDPVSDQPMADPQDEGREVVAERERALRLARIAVSEMLLYSPDKFDDAIRDGNLEQALDLEIQEARALLRQRVSEEIRAETDFIIDELKRVAAERGGLG
ncbi:MAG: hypothetical protein GY910_11810 [bacterium]|nr:hypothetical protein [Deltaproteobacteria bacterium]MCP4905655.1 hypothetical protein [bacterium]